MSRGFLETECEFISPVMRFGLRDGIMGVGGGKESGDGRFFPALLEEEMMLLWVLEGWDLGCLFWGVAAWELKRVIVWNVG